MAPSVALLAAAGLALARAFREVLLHPSADERPEPAAWAALQLNASGEIFGGTDVKLRDVDEGFKAGPFPSFVTLVLKKKVVDRSKVVWHKCGGTLYRRKFILTAAHCVTYDPADWDLHAYLNPFLSPYILEEFFRDASHDEMAELLRPGAAVLPQYKDPETHAAHAKHELAPRGHEPRSRQEALAEFGEDQLQGLGRWLEVAMPPQGQGHFGYLHPKYELAQGVRPADDVALIPLATAPFDDHAPEWRHLGAELGRFAVGEEAMAIGIGDSIEADELCGRFRDKFGRQKDPHTCHLQQKTMEVLPNRECVARVLQVFWGDTLVAANSTLRAILGEFRENFEYWKSAASSGGGPNSAKAADAREGGEALEDAELDRLLSDASKVRADFRGLKDGRQFCVMSTDRSGNLGNGDFGGPLIAKDGSVVGVASWSVLTDDELQGMADGHGGSHAAGTGFFMPSVYASAAAFQGWIDATIDAHK